MHKLAIVLSTCLCCAPALGQVVETQSDWCGGPDVFGPVPHWGNQFLSASDTAWRSISGQLALAGTPLEPPVQRVIAADAGMPHNCAVGDVDGDGVVDVLSVDPLSSYPHGGVFWWKRQSPGLWTRHVVDEDFYGARHASVADVDRDGDLDVLAAAYYGDEDVSPEGWRNGRYAWFENLAGDGTAWTQHLVGELFWGGNYIDAGDLDGDGDIDIAGSSELTRGVWEQASDITWFENLDGDGTEWSQHELEEDTMGNEAHVVDLDGDGDMDVVSAEEARIGWWENRHGDGSLWLKRYVTTELRSLACLDVGDIDNDGDLDIIGSSFHVGFVAWWENTAGDGTVWFPRYVASASYSQMLELRDIDGDGDLDAAIVIGLSSGAVYWLENVSGDGIVWDAHLITNQVDSYARVALGDVNDDGRLDAVVSYEGAPEPPTHQLAWHDLTVYQAEGDLISSVLERGAGRVWGEIGWDAIVPPDTGIGVQVRASDDPYALGAFVDVPAMGTDLATLIDAGSRYFQYRINLSTADETVSPVVHDIAVKRYATGDYDGDGYVTLDDFSAFAACLAGPGVMPAPAAPPPTAEECTQAFDFDADADVDLLDFADFGIAFTGA